jgi:hypothetical protein
MRSRNRLFACLWLLPLAWAALACQGQNLAHTAQRGSTIAISLGGTFSTGAFLASSLVVGYGGTAFTDYQRGEMVYQLDGFGGPELITRATTTLLPHPASGRARTGWWLNTATSGHQHVSIVDIPTDAELGTHSVYVVRRVGGSDIQIGMHPADIKILPQSIPVVGPGGPEDVVGESTDFAAWYMGGWNDHTSDIPTIAPKPQLRLVLSDFVYAVEIDVTYPSLVIDVLDAIQASTAADSDLIDKRATVWFDDDGSGSATIHAAANGQAIGVISLVFGLDDGASQILEDPFDVVATVTAAYDENGDPLAGITVANQDIR